MAFYRSRYELKYIIDEPCAKGVRDFVRAHLVRDPYAHPDMRYSYPIYSLYLDGPGMLLYRATFQAQKNRYKLRIRYYDHNPDNPVFFEIKRRVGDVIMKDRTAVQRSSMRELLNGRSPRPSDLSDPSDAGALAILCRFCELRNAIHAEPKVNVYYQREAWVSNGADELRVTFDRQAAAAHYRGDLCPKNWRDLQLGGVVLELKFDERFPIWMRDLVQNWDLYRTQMGKYIYGVDQLPPKLRRMSALHA